MFVIAVQAGQCCCKISRSSDSSCSIISTAWRRQMSDSSGPRTAEDAAIESLSFYGPADHVSPLENSDTVTSVLHGITD